MGITDELREWAEDNTLQDTVLTTYPPQHAVHGVLETLLRIADRIDAEHQKAIRELNNIVDASMLLPVDADGVPVRIGDAMETERFGVVEVEGFIHNNGIAFSVYDPQPARICTVPANQCRHYYEPTVEDVLREFTDEILKWAGKSGTVAEVGTWSDVAADYAAKLRLANSEE